jgi:hypothetical protein
MAVFRSQILRPGRNTSRTRGEKARALSFGGHRSLALSKADEIRRQVKNGAVEIAFLWKQGVEVHTTLALTADALTVTVEKVILPAGTRLETITYPSRFAALKTGEDGYLVIPARGGAIIPSHFYTRIGGEFWRLDDAYRQNLGAWEN